MKADLGCTGSCWIDFNRCRSCIEFIFPIRHILNLKQMQLNSIFIVLATTIACRKPVGRVSCFSIPDKFPVFLSLSWKSVMSINFTGFTFKLLEVKYCPLQSFYIIEFEDIISNLLAASVNRKYPICCSLCFIKEIGPLSSTRSITSYTDFRVWFDQISHY